MSPFDLNNQLELRLSLSNSCCQQLYLIWNWLFERTVSVNSIAVNALLGIFSWHVLLLFACLDGSRINLD